ncbi:MAG: purine-nucleoside phosphorylase [Gemmatimonadetes bacterium]|nr:MAG: purine-nucleoside phosphorylase [Gemmatimonadota bacterium]PYO79813.1 MAG: purine-nucleoside phosphorylase [Gemmatimonadota bacterium]
MEYSAQAASRAAAAIRNRTDAQATIAVILGSGLGGLSKKMGDAVRIPFVDIPGFPEATVVGHEGAVIVGTLGGREILALSGRFHIYEGHPAALAAFPVRVFHALGARDLFVSNAAGGISPKLAVGDLMMISDHLNLMGTNPLVGDLQAGDTRFPDMTDAYDPGFRRILRTTAEKLGITLREGVYAGLLGPSYETPSEVKMLRMLGADAVGMSTVPEVIVARALGMRVAGVSCITNAAAGVTGAALSHAEVLATTNRVSAAFESLVTEFLERTAVPQLSPAR